MCSSFRWNSKPVPNTQFSYLDNTSQTLSNTEQNLKIHATNVLRMVGSCLILKTLFLIGFYLNKDIDIHNPNSVSTLKHNIKFLFVILQSSTDRIKTHSTKQTFVLIFFIFADHILFSKTGWLCFCSKNNHSCITIFVSPTNGFTKPNNSFTLTE